MVQVQVWDDFFAKAEELLRAKPLDCRYTVKYKHREGKMVLKVTDNAEVSAFSTNQPSEKEGDRRRASAARPKTVPWS